jgi:hypothetical protein
VTKEDEFAHRLITVLDAGVRDMDDETLRRLGALRRQAVASQHSFSHGHHILSLLQRHSLASILLALFILISGYWFVQTRQPAYSPETDILLLTGDLPPNAYADKTFSKWLDARSPF